MTKVLFCGSRETSDEALIEALKYLHRVKEHGWSVIVGDAEGVDQFVIQGCKKLGIEVEIYAPINKEPRVEGCIRAGSGYYGRDRVMVAHADIVIGFHNGTSRGTKYTVEAAAARKKPSYLWTDGKWRVLYK